MNALGFDHLPAHAATLDDDFRAVERRWVAGIGHRWQIPCAVYGAPTGFDCTLHDQREHHTLALQLDADRAIERADGRWSETKVKAEHLCLMHIGETHRYRIDHGDIGLETAAIAGCSATHFSRAFKQSTGQPPFAWPSTRRTEKAKELLAGTRVPLAEVAQAVGFAAQPQFTTAFKRVTGVTPGAWRRERLS